MNGRSREELSPSRLMTRKKANRHSLLCLFFFVRKGGERENNKVEKQKEGGAKVVEIRRLLKKGARI